MNTNERNQSEVVHRQLVEQRRLQIVVDVEAARRELTEGNCRETTVGELIREITP
jgi:hypothetical protein